MYSREDRETIAALVPELMDTITTRTRDLPVALSAVSSVVLSLLSITADVNGIEISHRAMDSILTTLKALREAQTVEELKEIYRLISDGQVGRDGTITSEIAEH